MKTLLVLAGVVALVYVTTHAKAQPVSGDASANGWSKAYDTFTGLLGKLKGAGVSDVGTDGATGSVKVNPTGPITDPNDPRLADSGLFMDEPL